MTATPCPTCRRGCNCDGTKGELNCGHSGCWGGDRVPPIDPCPGTAYETARSAVLDGQQTRARH